MKLKKEYEKCITETAFEAGRQAAQLEMQKGILHVQEECKKEMQVKDQEWQKKVGKLKHDILHPIFLEDDTFVELLRRINEIFGTKPQSCAVDGCPLEVVGTIGYASLCKYHIDKRIEENKIKTDKIFGKVGNEVKE